MKQKTLETSSANPLDNSVSRRNFLKAGAIAVAVPAAGMGAFYFSYSRLEGSPLRVGLMGVGDEGSVLLGAINPEFVDVKAIADIRPYNQWRAFHGDNETPELTGIRTGLMRKYDWKTEDEARKHVKVYANYIDLLKNAKADGIEAVIIGLPLHLHAIASIQAMRLGLHVLCEKLMAHSVTECKEMARVAKETGRHLAIGHQRHYNILYHEAEDQIERGLLGNIHYIRAQWHRNNSPDGDSWRMPMPYEAKPGDKLAESLQVTYENRLEELKLARGADIDVKRTRLEQVKAQILDRMLVNGSDKYKGTSLKSAAQYGYEDGTFGSGEQKYERPAIEELIRWRLWNRTGGGLMVELGSHQLDAASIFLAASARRGAALKGIDPDTLPDNGKVHPLKVHVSANRNLFGLDREVHDHITTIVEFPAPNYDPTTRDGRKRIINVQYSTINGNGFGGYGEIVYGDKGTIILEREADSQLLRGPSTSKVSAKAAGAPSALDTQASAPAQKAVATGPKQAVSRGYQEEIEHWAWCIRVNPNNQVEKLQPRCKPKIALADAVIALATNEAAAQGKSISFREEWFDPESDVTLENTVPNTKQKKYELS